MSHDLSAEAIERGLVDLGVPKDKARARALAIVSMPGSRSALVAPPLPPAQRVKAVAADLDGKARHVEGELLPGGGLRLVLPCPPRTKKNGTTLGIRQTTAYRFYRDTVIALTAPLLGPLGLPLHPAPLNLCALYYVDKKGERADLIGLHQGLADALENAEIVVDDHWFKTLDGSRIITGDPSPRVECTITLLDPPPTRPAA